MANSPENGKPLYESIRNRWGCCIWSAKNFWTQRQGPPNRSLVVFGPFARCDLIGLFKPLVLFALHTVRQFLIFVIRTVRRRPTFRFRWPLLKELSHKNKGNERKEIGHRSNKNVTAHIALKTNRLWQLRVFQTIKSSFGANIFDSKKKNSITIYLILV